MSTLPATMTAIEITRARRARGAAAGDAADAAARRRRGADRRSRPPASTGPTCCSARATIRRRRAPPTFPASRSPARSSRSGSASTSFKLGDEVCALVTGGGYADLLRRARAAMPAGAQGLHHGRGGGAARDLLHRLAQSLRARPARSRRERADPWRLERHRHHRDPARPRASARGRSSPPPAAATNATPARASARRARIDYKHEDFVKIVKDATGGRGVDVILDMVGGDYIQRNLSALAVEAGSSSSPSCAAPRPRSISCRSC